MCHKNCHKDSKCIFYFEILIASIVIQCSKKTVQGVTISFKLIEKGIFNKTLITMCPDPSQLLCRAHRRTQ